MAAPQPKGGSSLRGMVPLGTLAPRRNTARIAAGVLVLMLSMLGAVIAYQRVGDRKEVVIVVQGVQPGEPIPLTALGTVRVASDVEVDTVNAAAIEDVVLNFTAGVELVPGSLLTPKMLSDGTTSAIGENNARMGVVVEPGRVPLVVSPGETVRIFTLGTNEGGGVVIDSFRDVSVISSRRIISTTTGSSGSTSAGNSGASGLFESFQIDVVTTPDDARYLAPFVANQEIVLVTIRTPSPSGPTTTTVPSGEEP